MPPMDITPDQCRAARGLLRWSQRDLAAASRLSKNAVLTFENGATTPLPVTLAALRAALEKAGVEFIDEDGGGAGVRWRKPPHTARRARPLAQGAEVVAAGAP
jgi:transcriptional regulator with XRE-family HTH domain